MPVQVQYQPDDICVLRISGILKRSEFAAEQSALTRSEQILGEFRKAEQASEAIYATDSGEVSVVGANYSLDAGSVSFLDKR